MAVFLPKMVPVFRIMLCIPQKPRTTEVVLAVVVDVKNFAETVAVETPAVVEAWVS